MKKFTKILSFAALTLSLSSCLKDKGYDEFKYGLNQEVASSNKVINMPVSGTTFTISKTISLAAAGATPVSVTLPIHLSAQDVASENIAVTVASDDARLATYNATLTAANQYQRLPDANFTIANGGITTIPAGSRDAGGVTITYTPNNFPGLKTGRWAIPVSIKSVDKAGYVISTNQAYRILLIIVNP
ncbi:DUF1735 domain-containing protein [Mucilaginibacter auburnensis]|uniref:Uncharacterized protein DUF1735 n=1 Tax=Mucilaginibacter auburnensis TaxID=1457233 RepID=A0A2H9VRQ3_9SPHI|nr:DUF1735 domain-containing protein [Mucilaginibacter auburnensis]PJJ83506.1 uncharacterized protein DUF1735 [Mucilaginibacter auburnensis]